MTIAFVRWKNNPVRIFLRASKALKTFESMFFGGILARLRMLLTSAELLQIPSSTEAMISVVGIGGVGTTENLRPCLRPFPVDLAIKVATKRLRQDATLLQRTSLPVEDIIDLLPFCLNTTYLLCV